MSNQMFCFQCEQTAKGTGCTTSGVCGKSADTANLQDDLTSAIVALARSGKRNDTNDWLMLDGLFTTVTNVSFDDDAISLLTEQINNAADTTGMNMNTLWSDNEDTRSLRSLLLLGIRGMAAYAHHAYHLGYRDETVMDFFYRGMSELADEHTIPEWLHLVMEFGQVNLKCMELLDKANTETYGTPEPTETTTNIEKGPFIVITGHDLYDMKQLLEQTEGKGVNIYTHGEMLPGHAYPELKKYPHLKGNFGTAWQNQQEEFLDVPCAFLFTTNCIMPIKDNYADKVFTTSVVGHKDAVHIQSENGRKDFTPVIEKALALGGYKEDRAMTGINGGNKLLTGFGHGTVLSVADTVIDAVKSKALRHIFLVGGCDGAKPGRNYYTDFVKQTPEDTVILTLACGKYRFNDLDLGTLGGLPRIMDMGQCNDAYSAIKVAIALAEAFECDINDLPLTLVLSWYEQKAVCILLTLLSLGMKNILIGPSLPAFLSPAVLSILVEKFNLTPISTPEDDLAKILNLTTVVCK